MDQEDRRTCDDCQKNVKVNRNGSLRKHLCAAPEPAPATDLFQAPAPVAEDQPAAPGPVAAPGTSSDDRPPVVAARFDGECTACDGAIFAGDEIRADGTGGWEHADCDDDTPSAPVQTPAPAPAADLFQAPAPVIVEPELNVSGQPKSRYEWRGRMNLGYLVTDPETGEFRRYGNGNPRGWTRATTFNKAISDSTAIHAWGKRNVLIGAAARPNIVSKAHRMTHADNRADLDRLVAELEEAAGANVASDIGTELHAFTEYMDAGLKTWQDAPEQYQRQLALYAQTLADAGLEPVPGLIERTTGIREFGGVVGTFDRTMYHRPSDSYVVVDLKTGKTMEYAMAETQTQEWIYAHGINQNGLYDWHTDKWSRYGLPKVREDVGVVIHMPVQGDQAGTVNLIYADLVAGRAYAELCHQVRSKPKATVRAWTAADMVPSPVEAPAPAQVSADVQAPVQAAAPVPVQAPAPAAELTWDQRFEAVNTSAEASALWREAKAAGLDRMEIQRLVQIAQMALRVKG